MVYIKNHVFKALILLCMIFIGLMIWKKPVYAAEADYVYSLNYYWDYDRYERTYFDYTLTSQYPLYCWIREEREDGFISVGMIAVDDVPGKFDYPCYYNGNVLQERNGNVVFDISAEDYFRIYKFDVYPVDLAISQILSGNFVGYGFNMHSGKSGIGVPLFDSADSLAAFLSSGDDSGMINKAPAPEINWKSAWTNPYVYLKNFDAELSDDGITVRFDEFHFEYHDIDFVHGYVTYQIGFALSGLPPSVVTAPRNVKLDYYFEWVAEHCDYVYTDHEELLSLANVEVPEGYYLAYIKATPYVRLFNEDENGHKIDEDFFKGKASFVYFTEDGEFFSATERMPEDEFDPENEEYSIFNSITNFFSDFWGNLFDLIYDLIVPDGDQLIKFLEKINDWFSERLGFIWYPFDLAIQMVTAFTTGSPDTGFRIPAGELNIMGTTYVLWEAQEINIDQIGIFVYVRYFTSALLAFSVVRLAVNKWDDWIGGRVK